MPTVAAYGTWTSPISAESLADGSHTVAGGQYAGDEIWWLELRPAEGGRYAVRRHAADGSVEDVLPAPWNARTRVHEYGGGAWLVVGATLVFANFDDQRLYRLEPGGEPVALTPSPPEPAAPTDWRYADLQLLRDGEIWCVRERHDADGAGGAVGIVRDIAVVPLDGSAAADESAIRSVAGGSDFLASPRLSPSGTTLAWIAWDHPRMPWDGTELRVAPLRSDGTCGEARALTGSPTESVLQPEWVDDSSLLVSGDRDNFWNLYRVGLDGSSVPLAPVDAEIGAPMWTLGTRRYRALPDGRLLTVRTSGTDTLAILDPRGGGYDDIDLGDHTSIALGPVRGDRVLLTTGGARTVSGLRELDLATPTLTDVRLALDAVPDESVLPSAELRAVEGTGGREVHTIVYRPRNAAFTAPDGELPPFVAFVHGGPTSQAQPALSTTVAYYTSRGIGVVDVNYGGSTGYGREYRDRLRGQWGVVDVQDTVSAVLGLADAGIADRDRLAVEGGSAGGWTVLSALTSSDAFACGISRYGVAELVEFVRETHDFESRYVDGLIGPLPEARELYDSRAPLSHVNELSCPVLLLQGLDDPIVPPAQAERFRDALVANGLPYAYRTYAGESHGFRKRETIIDAAQASLSFYGQIMGFEPPGVPVLEVVRPEARS